MQPLLCRLLASRGPIQLSTVSAFCSCTAGTAIRQGHPEALDPALDFFSPLFDAAKALAAPGLKPPRPKARPLDNVAKCRALLPPELEDSAAYRQMLRPVVSPEVKPTLPD